MINKKETSKEKTTKKRVKQKSSKGKFCGQCGSNMHDTTECSMFFSEMNGFK